MAHERLTNASLPRALSEVVADIADLLQKELRLAKAELSAKISTKLAGSIWLAAAAIMALMAIFIVLQAIIFAIASYGFAMHSACLLIAGLLAVIAGGAFLIGRADAQEHLTPERAIHQIKQDISTAKEQLT